MSAGVLAILGVLCGTFAGLVVVWTIAALAGDVAEGTVYSVDEWREKERR